MADDPRPMPQVTISDPGRPGRPADVLMSGDERPPVDPATRRRRQLVSLDAGPGLRVVPYVGGRPGRLPLELPVSEGLLRALTVTLLITVADCAQAQPDGGDPGPVPVSVGLQDAAGGVVVQGVDYPPDLLRELVSDSCG